MKTKIVLWILILSLFTALVNASDHITQTHVDETPYSTNTNTGQYGLIFRMTEPDLRLENVTYINGHSHTHSCLYNYPANTLIKCVDITGDITAEFNEVLTEGNKYFVAGLRNGSVHATKYKNPGSYWYTPTEAQDYLVWESGLTLGTTFPPDPINFANNSFWISVNWMEFYNTSVPPVSGGDDFITISNITNSSTSNSTCTFDWDTAGNYSPDGYTEIFADGILRYNGSTNYTVITGLGNNTFYIMNFTVYGGGLTNTSQSNCSVIQTTQMDWISFNYYNTLDFLEEQNMIYIILLWIFMTAGALTLMIKGNRQVGIWLWILGFGFDFILIARLYEEIGLPSRAGFIGFFYAMFYISLGVWLLSKFFIPVYIRSYQKKKA